MSSANGPGPAPQSSVTTEFDQGPEVTKLRARAREALGAFTSASSHAGVDRDLVAVLAESGFLGMVFPAQYGGQLDSGMSAVELCRIREALASESVEAEAAFALQGLGSYPILQSGSRELAQRWIPEVAAGRAVAAFALTEPEHGSDAGALSLRADSDGDGFRLTGSKVWISNAPEADVYTLFARTTQGAGPRGVTAFAVPGDAPGLTGASLSMIAAHPIGTLELDGVYVPRQAVLGTVNAGFKVAMQTLDLFRPSVGACALGMAQTALDMAIFHAGQRQAFGVSIAGFQGVSHKLAEMATSLQAARLLVRQAAEFFDQRSPQIKISAARAKLFATETAQWVIDDAIQIHGARALESGHRLEGLYRAVRSLRIYEGTSEIQRNIISRELLLGAVRTSPGSAG